MNCYLLQISFSCTATAGKVSVVIVIESNIILSLAPKKMQCQRQRKLKMSNYIYFLLLKSDNLQNPWANNYSSKTH